MKKTILTGALLMLYFSIFAQTGSEHINQTRKLYSNFFNYNVPGDVISDISIGSSLFAEHEGKRSDSANTTMRFKEILLNLRNAHADPSQIVTSDSLAKLAGYYRDLGHIPISIINFEYTRFDTAIYTWSGLSLDSIAGKFIITGNPENFFETRQCISIALLDEIRNRDKVSFILPEELYFCNPGNSDSIFIDFGDGLGFRYVQLDQPVNIDYSGRYPTDEELITIPVEFSTSAKPVEFVRSDLYKVAYPNPDDEFQLSELHIENPCEMNDDYSVGEARIYIRYGAAQVQDKVLRKPVIIVEGFDVDDNPFDNRYGDVGWPTFITGISFDPNNKPVRKNLLDLPVLAHRLYQENFDVVLVDFKNGGANMFENGAALIKIIQWVNQSKIGDEELVVLGASMGGLLARYALRKMELEDCNHCTKLYVTFDSPHQGANIPIGLQHAISFFSSYSSAAAQGYAFLKVPSAQQMLIYNITPNAIPMRQEWQNWLNSNGHPQRPRRIALTNGNPVGKGDYSDGVALYKRCFQVGFNPNFICNIYAAKENQVVFKGKIPAGTSGIFGWVRALAGSGEERELNAPANHEYFDHVPGGTAGWINGFNKSINKIFRSLPYKNKCSGATMINNGYSCFVPTFSALDFYSMHKFPDLKNLFPDAKSMKSTSSLHPFHAIYYHSSINPNRKRNQEHVLIDKEKNQNIDWIMEELELAEQKIELELPTASGRTTFNYNDLNYSNKTVPDLQIQQGGLLQLNGNYRVNYGLASDPVPTFTGHLQEFRTLLCGSYIEVLNGGVLEIGDDNPAYPSNNKAVFKILKGSVVDLGSSGLIRIHNGSSLVIEEGAVLIYRDNAQIELLGENASIKIMGQMELKADAEFAFSSGSATKKGYLHFVVNEQNAGELIAVNGNNCKITFSGSSGYSGTQCIVEGGLLKIPAQLSYFTMDKVVAKMTDKGGVALYCPALVQYTRFEGFGANKGTSGLQVYGSANSLIKHNVFNQLSTGLLHNPTGTITTGEYDYNTFAECEDGMVIMSGKVNLLANNFTRNTNSGLLYTSGHNSLIRSCKFTHNNNAISQSNSNLQSCFLKLENNYFTGNQSGILGDYYTSWTLTCNVFEKNVRAIELFNGSLNMSPLHLENGEWGGENTFYNNKEGIRGIMNIYLEAGANNFFKASANNLPFIEVLIPSSCSCLNPLQELEGGGNYWYPVPSGGMISSSPPYYAYIEVSAFPHPILSGIRGNVLSGHNANCFILDPDYETELNEYEAVSDIQDMHVYEKNIHVYPIPASEQITINIILAEEHVSHLELTDLQGRVIIERDISLGIGPNRVELSDLQEIRSGIYILRLSSSEWNATEKIIIKHQ